MMLINILKCILDTETNGLNIEDGLNFEWSL